ncbi:MAG: prolipoprotein diacylglyceryl transferase [Bacilli bacterium]|nr:prolipoprotein diacylglyceryl transferase [Bacilli bacterium]MDD4607546.1 prolipoprotein diacylglyceryl transferase [Bacilli bacterium]
MKAVLLDLGVIRIYWYSAIMFIAILLGGSFTLRESKRFNVPENFMINLFFFMIPLAIIGARLYYVAFNWSYYSNNLIDIVKLWEGGLAIHGAIIVGLIWVIFYTKRYKVRTLRILDFMALGLIIGQAIGRWGNFFNGEAHGPEIALETLQKFHLPEFIIEGMNIGGVYYHPTFLYESIWCLIGFILLLIIKRYKYLKIGQLTSIYFIWYGIGRFLIEWLRTDSLMIGDFKIAQIVSLVMIVFGFIMMIFLNRGSRFKNQYNEMSDINEIKY